MEKEQKLSYDRAKNKALKYLEYRSHSERELCDKLYRAGADSETTERVLEFLREYNFVNDRDYAIRYAKDLKNLRKLGKKRVFSELIKKGICRDFAVSAVESLDWEDSEPLLSMARSKLSGNFDKKSRDKCMRYFLYKGYDFDEIKKAINKIQSEEENGI